MLDRHELYECCVQSPDELVGVLRSVHGDGPTILGEDFCGTAALSAAWVRLVPGGQAIAVDHDPEPLTRARRHAGVRVIEGDVVADTFLPVEPVDVLYVGNFSIGEWHTRDRLMAYLEHARTRLHPGGVLVTDTYGGDTAFVTGATDGEMPGPGGRLIKYTWEQRSANPLTGEVVNALHFEVHRDGRIEQTLHDAFVYRWRLWSVPELRDALSDAGFTSTDVYHKIPDAVDENGTNYLTPITDPEELEDSFDVLVVGRAGA